MLMNNFALREPISASFWTNIDWDGAPKDETESQSWEPEGVDTVTRRSKELDEGGVAEVVTDTLRGALPTT